LARQGENAGFFGHLDFLYLAYFRENLRVTPQPLAFQKAPETRTAPPGKRAYDKNHANN